MLEGDWSWLGDVVGPALAAGPGGLIDDDLAYVAPWGCDPADVAAPVLILHGGRDRIVPSAHGEWLARHCRTAELRLSPEDGHLSILTSATAALEWLRHSPGRGATPRSDVAGRPPGWQDVRGAERRHAVRDECDEGGEAPCWAHLLDDDGTLDHGSDADKAPCEDGTDSTLVVAGREPAEASGQGRSSARTVSRRRRAAATPSGMVSA